MSEWARIGTQGAVIVLIALLLPCIYQLARSRTAADRLQIIDTITTLLIGIIVVLALLRGDWMFIDIAIALAAFAFIGTLALARYISEKRVF